MPPMSIQSRQTLTDFADWIVERDEHASSHLHLLGEAEAALAGECDPAADGRLVLADKLDRWRYHLLNQGLQTLAPTDRALIDVLDLTANELAGRPARAPRSPRAAIQVVSPSETSWPQTVDFELTELEDSLRSDVPLEELTRLATSLTVEHFSGPHQCEPRRSPAAANELPGQPRRKGARQMVLYAPLYLSNYCTNHCLYCGFRYPNELQREHLSKQEALSQAQVLWKRGIRRLVLVAGDFPRLTTTEYFAEIIRDLKAAGFDVTIELAAQSTASYAELVLAGASGVTLYQETYDERLYARYHRRGSKKAFDWRLEAPERAAEAGMARLGLGVLLGLSDPAQDVFAMVRHGLYLQTRFPDVRLAFSLPRIHKAPDGFESSFRVDDETFIRLYCFLRLAFPQAHLVLSTRESPALRHRLASICITQMSAGSSTAPGGYQTEQTDQSHRQQFPDTDDRSPAEVEQGLRDIGFDVCWK